MITPTGPMALRSSLAQQLAQFTDATPVEFDADDGFLKGASEKAISGAGAEHYVEMGASTLRRAVQSVSDSKYQGAKTSRSALMELSGSEGESDKDEDEDNSPSISEEEEGKQREPLVARSPLSAAHLDDVGTAKTLSLHNEPLESSIPEDATSTSLDKIRQNDQEKGRSICNQMTVCDSLLDTRIRLQKSANAVNRLPKDASSFLSIDEEIKVKELIIEALKSAASLTDQLFTLENKLLKSPNAWTAPPTKRRKLDISHTLEGQLATFQELSQDTMLWEQTLHPYLASTLAKWHTKIQTVTPSVLLPSNRNSFRRQNDSSKSILHLIDESLSDHAQLLSRTRKRKGKGPRLENTTSPPVAEDGIKDEDGDLFDDLDFYQQLLRDVIDSQDHASDDWLMNQRQKKITKKVDTKASKGRKIRYEVHEKLQNFMVPIAVPGTWHNEQVDELFGSLLGQASENANEESTYALNKNDTTLMGGFKLFR